jgi:N6-adenosine-specific RNA methylase IME4
MSPGVLPITVGSPCDAAAMNAPTAGYRCIAVDPPWPQKGAGTLRGREGWLDCGGKSAEMPYRTMSIAEISALPVATIAHPEGAHLYLWTTNGFLPHAYGVLAAWGFTYSTTLVWAKTPMGNGLGGAWGISTEFCLFARRGRVPALGKVRGTWHHLKRPYDERGKPRHSSKPDDWYQLIEQVSPGARVDLFARRARPGWDAWGDQAPNPIDLPLLPEDEAAS